ncbi:MAG: pseudouridine-5'-phosphate glycosidase [Ilumatobacteraceae bacterium]|nr:pseudouridine-5'-phosphate glycosidase [Ilumatobacteraceae bacterium]
MIDLNVSAEVTSALAEKRAVVALESTIFSHLGLPSPSNREALDRCLAAVRALGAVPAITAVLDGVARVGLIEAEHERILGAARKVAERDLPVAIGERWGFGATTVSASLALAARAGINVFATGGIGGVHRGAELHGDVSADLPAIARHPVVTVSAGAKSFLDLPRTLEMLETLGVPVIGYQCDDFPAFTVASSGIALQHRIDDIGVLARIARTRLDFGGGMLVCTPVPMAHAVDAGVMNSAIERALAAAQTHGVSGPAITPMVLAAIAADTAGAAVSANLALAENNARLAAAIAVGLAALPA